MYGLEHKVLKLECLGCSVIVARRLDDDDDDDDDEDEDDDDDDVRVLLCSYDTTLHSDGSTRN